MKSFEHGLYVGPGGAFLALLVDAYNKYGAAVITTLTIAYLLLGIRNRWLNKKDDK
jgi:hypothetical protein